MAFADTTNSRFYQIANVINGTGTPQAESVLDDFRAIGRTGKDENIVKLTMPSKIHVRFPIRNTDARVSCTGSGLSHRAASSSFTSHKQQNMLLMIW